MKSVMHGLTPETLAAHLNTAFSTDSGRVALEWLAVQCFMRPPFEQTTVNDPALELALINGRRDLFLNLETIIKENRNVRIELTGI